MNMIDSYSNPSLVSSFSGNVQQQQTVYPLSSGSVLTTGEQAIQNQQQMSVSMAGQAMTCSQKVPVPVSVQQQISQPVAVQQQVPVPGGIVQNIAQTGPVTQQNPLSAEVMKQITQATVASQQPAQIVTSVPPVSQSIQQQASQSISVSQFPSSTPQQMFPAGQVLPEQIYAQQLNASQFQGMQNAYSNPQLQYSTQQFVSFLY